MKHNLKYNYLWAIIALISLAGCTDDFDRGTPPPANNSAQGIFTLRVPKKSGLETRAMTEEEEYRIEKIAVLAFVDNGGTEELSFYHKVPDTGITRDGTDNKKYTIATTLKSGTYSSIILIANSESVLDNSPLLVTGTSRATIQSGLIREVANNTKWNAGTSTTDPDFIPLFGEVSGGSAGITITPGQAPFSSVPMNSMLARINLTNNADNFELEAIHLYHFRRDGLIIPGQTPPTLPATVRRHTEALTYGTETNEIYVFEQEPGKGEQESDLPFMVIGGKYGGSNETTWYRIDFVNRINEGQSDAHNEFIPLIRNHGYTFVISEVKGKGYDSSGDAAQCLPVNTITDILIFDDGDVENILFDGKYYLAISLETMEFDKNADSQLLSVKTDNPLGWEIEKIPADATWLNIDRTEPSGPNDDGELTVSVLAHTDTQPRRAAFKVSAGRLEYTLPVEQSFVEGISLEIIGEDGEEISEVLFRSNPGSTNKTALNQKFTVKWKGPACTINVGMIGNRKITLPPILSQGSSLTSNEQLFDLPEPAPFAFTDIDPVTGIPFLEEGAAVTFEVDNGVEKIQRTLVIRHQCVNIVFDNLEELCYMGHRYPFRVRSNSGWKITYAEAEIDGLFQTETGLEFSTVARTTTGGYDINTGTAFTLRLPKPDIHPSNHNYGIGKAGRKLRITFEDEEDIFPPVTKTIFAILPDANSFRLLNGGGSFSVGDGTSGRNGSIEIPLRKLYWIWEKELDTELNPSATGGLGLTAVLVWQSFNGLLQTTMSLTDAGGNGDYRDYVLSLKSTDNTGLRDRLGNALVAIRDNTGKTLWSFHIWVTNYFPEDGQGSTFTNTFTSVSPSPVFMDYHLGATINYNQFNPHQGGTPPVLSPDIGGLFYQHGRKDPFPGPAQMSTTGNIRIDTNPEGTLATLVTLNGQRMIPAFTPVTDRKNLEKSILNPTTFYTNNNGSTDDWYTTGETRGDQYDYFWRDKQGRKGMYDPCPPGWRLPDYKPKDMEGAESFHEGNTSGAYLRLTDNNRMFLPLNGYIRIHPTGNYMEIRNYGTVGYFVCGDTEGVNPGGNRVSQTEIRTNASPNGGRASATPLRCKKDDYPWYEQNY